MKTILFLLFTFISLGLVNGQSKDEILAEAYLLYNSEKASWNGTDLLIEKFPEKGSDVGGYFSYTKGVHHYCIFYDRDINPNVLIEFKFKDGFNLDEVEINDTPRMLTKYEFDLFTIRTKALEEIASDDLFKHYENANLNPIPIIVNNKKKVYVLTGPEIHGVVLLGNDYLLTFNKKNKLKSKEALHKNLIPIEYHKDHGEDVTTIHNHQKSSGDMITSTDLCTLMLYQDFTKWEQHIVISDKKVSIWNCENESLMVLSKKAWERISAN